MLSAEGLVTSAVDLATGRDAITAGRAAGLLQLHPDLPNQWDAWDIDRFYRNTVRDLREVTSLVTSVDVTGVAKVVVERQISADSTVRQTFSLSPGARTLHVEQVTDWHEVENFLKVAFPLDVRAEHTERRDAVRPPASTDPHQHELGGGAVRDLDAPVRPCRGTGVRCGTRQRLDLRLRHVTRRTEDAVTSTIRLSLLRAPRFPDPETDHGVHTHRYGLVVGTGVGGAAVEGVLLNTPPRVVTGSHGFAPLVRVDGDGVHLSCVKLAADRSGDLVVRVHEVLGGRARGRVRVDCPVASVVEVNLLEEPVEQAAGSGPDPSRGHGHDGPTPGDVVIALGPFEVRTLRFVLAAVSPS